MQLQQSQLHPGVGRAARSSGGGGSAGSSGSSGGSGHSSGQAISQGRVLADKGGAEAGALALAVCAVDADVGGGRRGRCCPESAAPQADHPAAGRSVRT